ncbi:MAG TPA: SDR family oxidoreductase [Mycobacteriales bacterium]|jgi:NAD(P)-dependent dehydrogenase (short-subunit alcohol dehydrogenase family)|nr:SDR family oxidoreductase [Mycobacteriales bacterium]
MNPHPAFDGKHVVVTGAASGIGRAVATAAAERGAIVHLTDRNSPLLEEVAGSIRGGGGRVGVVRALDVREIDEVRGFAAAVHEQAVAADIVMNVAGIAIWGTVEQMSHEQWRSVIDVNLMGPIHVIESFLPKMVDVGRGGHLVNVSSAAGLFGLPWHGAYSASKFGLRGLSEVLRFDLRRHKIAVTLVCPGGVDTPLGETVEVAGVDTSGKRFQKVLGRFRKHAVTSEQAADAIIRGVIAKRYLVFTSGDIRLLYVVKHSMPHVYNLFMRIANAGAYRAMKTDS